MADEQPRPEPPSPVGGRTTTDAVIIPLDAWTRVLNQLGNLHEAGHELAEARERAARAETQVEFLRERLSELRQQLEVERTVAQNTPPAPAADASPVRTRLTARDLARRWRGRLLERLRS